MSKYILLSVVLAMTAQLSFAQALPGARGGRTASIPNATPEQTAAVARMNLELEPLSQALAAARAAVTASALTLPRRDADIRLKVEAVKAAEQTLALARAEGLTRLQASSNRLSAEQLAAVPSSGAGGFGRGGGGANSAYIPHLTGAQGDALYSISEDIRALSQPVTDARSALTAASFAQPRSDTAILARVNAVAAAELATAFAISEALAKFQTSPNKLDSEQSAAFAAAGGSFGRGGFSEPQPADFNDHRGYVSLFDGVSLKGWDGNSKFWRAENGTIVGESTPANPSGNTYIVYRGVSAHDFTLKFEIKIEGTGGSGLQYRSKSGIPWRRPIPANVTANVGPVNLNWMLTGPQADFWPSQIYSGQFYSENTPMGIMAYRGEVVEGQGMGERRLMGRIGDRTELGKLVRMNDWNEYTVIARGGTFIHIINGQLMAVMVDDDPNSSNNWSGQFGIEIEATTKVSVRNIWLKKLN